MGRVKEAITLFLAFCLPILLIGTEWLVSVLSYCLWWSLLVLEGKLMCKGTWKSPLLPLMSAQDKVQACPKLLQVEIAVQALGPGILQIHWDGFHRKCSVCLRRPLVIGCQGGSFKKKKNAVAKQGLCSLTVSLIGVRRKRSSLLPVVQRIILIFLKTPFWDRPVRKHLLFPFCSIQKHYFQITVTWKRMCLHSTTECLWQNIAEGNIVWRKMPHKFHPISWPIQKRWFCSDTDQKPAVIM